LLELLWSHLTEDVLLRPHALTGYITLQSTHLFPTSVSQVRNYFLQLFVNTSL